MLRPVPLENTILGLTCDFPAQRSGLHRIWQDVSVPLSMVTTLVRDLITVPVAVCAAGRPKMRSSGVAARERGAAPPDRRVRYDPADRIWLATLSR
jgi:putative transposase